MFRQKKFLALFGAMLALFSAALWATSASVEWNPSRFAPASIAPGETLNATVTFTNKGSSAINDSKLSLEVRGDAASIVSVTEPAFPQTIKKGESVSVNLSVQSPSDTAVRVVNGSLVLLESKPKGTKDTFSATLPLEITLSPFSLPPEPNEAENEATVAGVDTNANGVRDDIDRFIGFAYPESEKRRMALTEDAKAEQKFMMDYVADPNNELQAQENARLSSKAQNCRWYTFEATGITTPNETDRLNFAEFVMKDTKTLLKLTTNTKERYDAYFGAEKYLGGMGFPDNSNGDKSDCSFNPDLLPN